MTAASTPIRPFHMRFLRTRVASLARSSGTLVGLLVIVIVFAAVSPSVFLTSANLHNILDQIAVLTIIAAVQTAVMAVGDFDLSVGASASLAAVIAGESMQHGISVPLAVLLALAAGMVVGLANGLLVAYIGLSAFIATLATMTSVVGLAYMITDGTALLTFPAAYTNLSGGQFLGFSYTVIAAALVVATMSVVLARSILGRRWYAIGGNARAAELSGVKVAKARVAAFVIVGTGAALGGIFLSSQLNQAQATVGDPSLLPSIAAVFLGMTMYRDGSPRVLGTVVGVCILGVLSNGLNIVGASTYLQQFVTGLIIILAIAVPSFKAKRHDR